VNFDGRRCTGYEFSKGAVHSCSIYDKGKEITVSRKAWMHDVWTRNGWDGVSRVTRVEFCYKRECLKELGIEEPYAMLDQLAGMWAYSTMQWMRHTVPTSDSNRGRWQLSPFWQVIQAADFSGEPVPLVRQKKRQQDLRETIHLQTPADWYTCARHCIGITGNTGHLVHAPDLKLASSVPAGPPSNRCVTHNTNADSITSPRGLIAASS
jgi:hypothetical protein